MGNMIQTAPPVVMPSLSSEPCPECGHDTPGKATLFRDLMAKLHLPAPKVRCRVDLDDETGWGAPECGCAHAHHG